MTRAEALNVAWHVRVNGLGDVAPSVIRDAFATFEQVAEALTTERDTLKAEAERKSIAAAQLFHDLQTENAQLRVQVEALQTLKAAQFQTAEQLREKRNDLQRRLDVCKFGGEDAAAEFNRRGEIIAQYESMFWRVEALCDACKGGPNHLIGQQFSKALRGTP